MFRIYKSNVIDNKKNVHYKTPIEVVDEASLLKAIDRDYVCAEYKDGYRSDANFIQSNCLPVDVDNDTTDDQTKWMTPEKLRDLFPGVTFAVHYSRNHMKDKAYTDKNGEVTKIVTARPRFHAFFEIDTITDSVAYKNLKSYLSTNYPYFDTNALDAGRFFFGTTSPKVEFFKGNINLSQFLDEEEFDKNIDKIKEGSRNATMSVYAAKVLKRLGLTDEARKLFDKKAEKCEPPLEDDELETIWNSAVRFFNKISKNKDYVTPDKFKSIQGLWPEDYSDMGEAKALINGYGADLIYTEPTEYLFYNGDYWEESKQLPVAVMEDFLDKQLADAEKQIEDSYSLLMSLGVQESDLMLTPKKRTDAMNGEAQLEALQKYEAANTYKNFVMRTRNMKYINSTLQAAVPMVLHKISELDHDPYLINTPEGTYDLRTGLGRANSKDDFITKQTNASPSDIGKQIWLDALNTFFLADKELIDYVQKVVGLAAIGCVLSEILVIAYGDGRNGKSTFWNTIAHVLGIYSGAISADSLTVGCKRNVKPELAELKGKRLVIAAELEEGMRMNTSIVKQLSSTDPIHAEKKYKPPFEFVPSHLTVLYTNHLPRVGAIDSGTWRRIKVIPFNAKIEGKSDKKNYTKFLIDNASGYIMKWIIEGAKEAYKLGGKIPEPSIVTNAIERYKEKNNWLQQFFDEMCVIDEKAMQKSGEFYTEYRNYCLRNGEYCRSTTDFYTELENAGFERKRLKTGVIIKGISIKKETDFD